MEKNFINTDEAADHIEDVSNPLYNSMAQNISADQFNETDVYIDWETKTKHTMGIDDEGMPHLLTSEPVDLLDKTKKSISDIGERQLESSLQQAEATMSMVKGVKKFFVRSKKDNWMSIRRAATKVNISAINALDLMSNGAYSNMVESVAGETYYRNNEKNMTITLRENSDDPEYSPGGQFSPFDINGTLKEGWQEISLPMKRLYDTDMQYEDESFGMPILGEYALQYGLPGIGMYKMLGKVPWINTWGRIILAELGTEFVGATTHEHDTNLANALESFGYSKETSNKIRVAIVETLAADGDDTVFERKVKNAIGNIPVPIFLRGAFTGVKQVFRLMKGLKHNKEGRKLLSEEIGLKVSNDTGAEGTFKILDADNNPIASRATKEEADAVQEALGKGYKIQEIKTAESQVVDPVSVKKKSEININQVEFEEPKRVGTTGQYIGAPPGVKNPQKLSWIRRKAYELIDHSAHYDRYGEFPQGRYWYKDSAKKILDLVQGDKKEADKLAQLIGVFSSGTGVGTDFGFAVQAYSAWRAGQDIFTGRFPTAQSKKAKLILEGENWTGKKTNNFYKAITREIDPELFNEPVVDIWMMRAFGFKNFEGTPTAAQYKFVANEIKRLTNEAQKFDPSWTVNQVQAQIWVSSKAQKVGMDLAKMNYADAIKYNLAQISWESAPGGTTSHLVGFDDLDFKIKNEYHVENSKLFLDENGNDLLAKEIGILSPDEFEVPGHFEGLVSPGSQTEVVIPKAFKATGVALDENTKLLVDAYAAAKAIVLKQDAIAWHRPVYGVSHKKANGLAIKIGKDGRIMTVDETLKVSEAANRIASEMSGNKILDFNLIGSKEGGRFLNVAFNDGGELIFSNKEFQEIITKAVNEVFPDNKTIVNLKSFGNDGNYISNDWSKNINGEGYLEQIRKRSPDLHAEILNILSTFVENKHILDQGFAAEHGLKVNEKINSKYKTKTKQENSINSPPG